MIGESKKNSDRNSGVSLVEFLVYIALIMVVLSAVVGFAVFQIRTNRSTQRTIDVVDNGRVIIEQIARDLKVANPTTIKLSDSNPAPCDSFFALSAASPQLLYPCIKFETLPNRSGAETVQTIKYQFSDWINVPPPRFISKVVNGIGTTTISNIPVDFLGFNVYYLPSDPQKYSPRISIILNIKSGTQDNRFQATVFLDKSYDAVPPKAPP